MGLAGRPILISGPAKELSLSLVKSYLHIDYTDDDATVLPLLIQSARERCEAYCNRKFIAQTWQAYYDRITKRFELPYPPIRSIQVSGFKLIYLDQVTTLLENQDFFTLNYNGDGFIILTATTYNLPAGFSLGDDLWRFNVQVAFTCGFDTDYTATAPGTLGGNGVPAGIQEAILKTVGSAYFGARTNTMQVSRQGVINIVEIPEDAKRLLQPYKNVTI